ncbi:MAG: condensation domain-containing protein, partial [Eubacteriales bacterium]|nr:condensation domain-containing protein [Eubacteriales bacterium]
MGADAVKHGAFMQLTKTQEGILNAEEIVGGAVSNICGAVFFTRQYSAEELNTAVNTVVRINDAFRLHFDRRTRTQWVEEYRWRDYDTVCFDTQADFERFAGEYAAAPLDTARALYDLKIVQIGGKTGLICVLHHMMCDAWSLSVLRWQLRRILEDKSAPPSFSFLEHCEEAQAYFDSRRFAGDRVYFLRQFHECKDRLPAVDPQPGDYQSGSLTFELAPGLREKISRCLERAGVSEYVLLLTAFGICYSRTRDCAGCFYIGTTVLNRTTEKDLHTIGPFINDIPLLFDLRDGQSAGEVLRDTDERVFNAFRHHRFNYPMLQEAIRGETPDPRLYDVIFNYQAEYETPDDAATAQWFRNGAQYETLQIHIDHRNDRGKRMITYNFLAERYTEKDIEKLHRHYMNVLESIITDDSRTVRDIPLMDEAEAAEIAAFSKGRPRPLPEKSLYDLIEEQQEGSIQDGEEEYSLSDLKRDAEKIDAAVRRREAAAGCLEKAAAAVRAEKTGDTACTKKTDNAARAEKTGAVVRAGKRVIGVICDRSYAELAAIYGIVRGGNAYLPIAPEFPPERINEILGISRCDTVLAQRKYRHLAKDALVIEEILDGSGPPQPLPAAAKPDDLLYVIFTSGSTGAPKGAMVSNRSAVNRILWMADKYFTSDTVVMLKTPYTFDVSVWEIFGFAVAGFKLYILPPYDHYRQDRVIEHICRGNVTDIHFVPSVFGSFLDALEQDAPEAPEKETAGKAEFSEKDSSAETPEKKAAGKAEFSEK